MMDGRMVEASIFNRIDMIEGVGIICLVYAFLQIICNYKMNTRIKHALLWVCLFSGVIIFAQTIYFDNLRKGTDTNILILLASLKYWLLAIMPVSTLAALEKESYVHSKTNAVVMMIIGAYAMSFFLNFFFPIYFTVDTNGVMVKQELWGFHAVVLFTIYTSALWVIFHTKYTLSFQEVASLITLVIIFVYGVISTDIDYHPGILELLCGLAILIMTNMFQALEVKICPISHLPYSWLLLANKKKLLKNEQNRVVAFTLPNLSLYNDYHGRREGDVYFNAFSRQVNEKLKSHGSLYRCPGNRILFFGKETKELQKQIDEFNETQFFGIKDEEDRPITYIMESQVCTRDTVYDVLKQYAA